MAFRARVIEGAGPQIGHTVAVYLAGTQTLVEGLIRPDTTALPLDNPFTILAEVWGFETPASVRVDIVANGKMLWPDVNIYDLGRDVGIGPHKIPRYDAQGRIPGTGTVLRYNNGILQWKYETESDTAWRDLVLLPVNVDGFQVVTHEPINYFPENSTIDSHLKGIDERLGDIIQVIIDAEIATYGKPVAVPSSLDFGQTNTWGEAIANMLTIDYGEVPQGGTEQSHETIILTNIGSGYLDISLVEITGDDSGEWQVISGGEGIGPIAPEGTHQIALLYAPTQIGEHTATLRIASNDPASPLSIELQGIGVEAEDGLVPAGFTLHVFGDGGTFATSTDGTTWTEGD